MKKSTGSILLLSAFAALVLAGCDNGPKDSSTSTGSSDTAVTTSADETSTPAGNSDSATGTSAGNSTTTSSATSSAAASSSKTSSSSAAASSSTQPVETDWSNKNFIGEYLGGMSNLIINADKSTSWGTSTDKIPATYTDMGGGVYMIKSAAGVADEDYVEVITDGTMAYVMHDKTAYDYYVMDKNALGSAVIAFCETQDEAKFFGGIEVTAGHWKYFACINGTYTFGATITMQAGTNINAGGAIFDFGTGANKSSWKVTRAAPAATAFAIIEQTNFNASTYAGEHGDLIIGTDSDGLVFAKLNGVMLDDAQLSADGTVLSVPNGSTPTAYDQTDPAGPMKVMPTTTYTLAKIALTYTEGTGTMKTPLFPTVSGDSGSYAAQTDDSGNVWVTYTATESGTLVVTETAGALSDSYLSVYDSTTLSYTSGSALAKDDNGTTTGCTVSITVLAGHAYVIKLGAYGDRDKTYTNTASTYKDTAEEFDWTLTPFAHDIYTGDAGDLDIMTDGTTIKSITIGGTAVTSFELDNTTNTLTTQSVTNDWSNPLDPVKTTTEKTFVLDPAAKTYTGTSSSNEEHLIGTITETDTSYSGTTGRDGNIWVTFTPSVSGSFTIVETFKGVSDSYLQVFEYDPATGMSGLTSTGAKRLKADDNNPATVTVVANAGVTYVIKLGAWGERNALLGDTASSSSNIGCTETFSFVFIDYTMETFSGAEGELVIATKDGEFKTASLDGSSIVGSPAYDAANGTLIYSGTGVYDLTTDPNNPTRTSTDVVFTLDSVNHTYVKTTPTTTRNIVATLDESSTGYSQHTTEDGNIWASFTPTADGYISIDETVKCDDSTVLAVYEKLPTSTWDSYKAYSSTYTGQKSLTYQPAAPATSNYYGTGELYVHDLRVQAGHTYIIKAGTSGGDYQTVGGAVSSTYQDAVDQEEAFTFSFVTENIVTYTGDNGNLTLTFAGDKFLGAKLGNSTIKGTLESNGKMFKVRGSNSTVNSSDPLDPIATYSNTLYYLDSEGLTYELDTDTEEVHMFQTLQPTDTSFTGAVGADGNLWGIFTAPEDGVIAVSEVVTAASDGDGYIAVYESTATSFSNPTSNSVAYNDNSYGMGTLPSVTVQAGHTYIIKGGDYDDRDKVIGGTGVSANAGSTETISFKYTGYTNTTYTGDDGDLVLKYFGETYKGATLNGVAFSGTPNDDKSAFTATTGAFEDGTFNIVTKTYTLGEGTYETSVSSEPTQVTLADSWTGANTGTYATLANGSVLIAFTPETSGSYTITLDGVAGSDSKLGVYAANFNATGFEGNPTESDLPGQNVAETVTIQCEAGKTYYIKASAYWSDFNKAITNMGAQASRVGVDLTITVAAA